MMTTAPDSYALAEHEGGELVLHRLDCPMLKILSATGAPILTMYEVQKQPGPEWPRHDCLKEEP